ncbi:MAG: oxidoreductase-like domain-containing protein [Pseudomonadota bacterium]|uniref:Oxidoreductase-like domain-containing protein n=1 Tax=Caldimonas aquatica TaxID=376175 RepID=A0ABY6MSV7_9BURK|nr:oxidoreductase-like domain-containing protein [Schlegelella aquatica]UZD55087.1 oxidoreductase-like domain-containing protein [Schlegelella aquatica]
MSAAPDPAEPSPPPAVGTDAGDDPPPPEPAPPAEGACCGSGCDPCVWDLYAEERARWMEAMRGWQARRRDAG